VLIIDVTDISKATELRMFCCPSVCRMMAPRCYTTVALSLLSIDYFPPKRPGPNVRRPRIGRLADLAPFIKEKCINALF